MELKKGQILYVLIYDPIIAINTYEIASENTNFLLTYSNEYRYEIVPIVEYYKPIGWYPICWGTRSFWIEKTLNLNKLIKYKTNNCFVSTNEELIIKRFNILLKYQQKSNESKTE